MSARHGSPVYREMQQTFDVVGQRLIFMHGNCINHLETIQEVHFSLPH